MYLTLRPDRRAGDRTGDPRARRGRVAGPVLLLGVVSLLTDVSSESVAAVLPLYLTAVVGLGPAGYGLVDGVYQGVTALVRLAGGYAADRGGRPKRVAVLGYGVSAVSRLALLPATGLAAVTATVTADRLGKGLRTAPRDALIAAASRPGLLGRSFGVHRALDTVGAAVGPLLAFGLLAGLPGDYSAVFVVSFAFAAVGVAVLVLFVPDLRTSAAAGPGGQVAAGVSPPVGPRRVLAEVTGRRLRRPLLAATLLALLTVSDGFVYLSLQDRDDFAARWFPLLYVGTNVAYLVLAVPFGRLADRFGAGRVLVAGHLALPVCYLLAAAPAGGLGTTVAVLALLGVFYAATDGVLPALVGRLAAGPARGSGIAAAQTAVALARFAASVVFGLLWTVQGRANALLLFAGLLTAAVPVAGWLLRGSRGEGGM
ncbi:MFS transporter [Micromonospora zhanjiangensis]|uniref:MFS transporter n=1 Tax=Micromonospora zhanjiangensis TaxID=1522057 RepID=A0ABV8KLP1_9ACTN